MRCINLRLKDILSSLEAISFFTEGMSKEGFCADDKTTDAVMWHFIRIGDSANNIPNDFRAEHPDVPWQLYVDTMHDLRIRYYDTDLNAIWKMTQNDLPPLGPQLQAILDDLEK